MQFGKVVTYPEIYGSKAEMPTTHELTKDLSSYTLIHYFSFINSLNFLTPYDLDTEKWILKQIIFRFEGKELEKLKRAYGQPILFSKRKPLTFFPLYSILKCINQELESPNFGSNNEPSREQELNILKRILVQNEEHDKEIANDFKKIESQDPLAVYKLVWPIAFPNSEFYERKRIFFALNKAINFLEFLESSDKFKPYLPEFYKAHSVASTEDYIKQILLLLKNGLVEKKRYSSYFPNNYDEINPLIKEFVLHLDPNLKIQRKDLNDFMLLRKYPIIKFKDGTIAITNWNFIIDKFYPAIIYDFFDKTSVKQLYIKTEEKKRINNYLSDIGKDFAEKNLFNRLISQMLFRAMITFKLGDEKDMSPDLYCRIGKHVFLTEFKNISLAKVKTFDEIKKLIDSRLITEKGSNKGILQLLEQVKKFQYSPEEYEDFKKLNINTRRLIIYPIIIYTDNALNMYGVNSYLNKIFREEIKKLNPALKFYVQDLAFISYDFLLDSYKLFKQKKVNLVYLMNFYYRELFSRRRKVIIRHENHIDLHPTFEEVVYPYMSKFKTYKSEKYYVQLARKRLFSISHNKQ